MRFAVKVFLCTIVVVATVFSVGGYLLISQNFDASMKREVQRALEEYQLLKFNFESGILNIQMQGQRITDETVKSVSEQVAQAISENRYFAVYLDGQNEVYSTFPRDYDSSTLLSSLKGNLRMYSINSSAGGRALEVAGYFDAGGKLIYIVAARDLGGLFNERAWQIRYFMFLDIGMIVLSAAFMLVLSAVLTRPIKNLRRTAGRIAGGRYSERVKITSNDEIGELARSFNTMAQAIEDKMAELELNAEQKEEFVANFAHELKTPLTSVIGYADLLRSKKCDEQTSFEAASFIFSESKRLEALSLKLLDLIVLNKQDFELLSVNTRLLLNNIAGVVAPILAQNNNELVLKAADTNILAERDLIKTLIINLLDNARKASDPGAKIELTGMIEANKYVVTVKDYGRGIEAKELARITEAFYMVDKSRARAQHGAGLGLALAAKIAELHHTKLKFESQVGEGTTVTLTFDVVTKAYKKKAAK